VKEKKGRTIRFWAEKEEKNPGTTKKNVVLHPSEDLREEKTEANLLRKANIFCTTVEGETRKGAFEKSQQGTCKNRGEGRVRQPGEKVKVPTAPKKDSQKTSWIPLFNEKVWERKRNQRTIKSGKALASTGGHEERRGHG